MKPHHRHHGSIIDGHFVTFLFACDCDREDTMHLSKRPTVQCLVGRGSALLHNTALVGHLAAQGAHTHTPLTPRHQGPS